MIKITTDSSRSGRSQVLSVVILIIKGLLPGSGQARSRTASYFKFPRSRRGKCGTPAPQLFYHGFSGKSIVETGKIDGGFPTVRRSPARPLVPAFSTPGRARNAASASGGEDPPSHSPEFCDFITVRTNRFRYHGNHQIWEVAL